MSSKNPLKDEIENHRHRGKREKRRKHEKPRKYAANTLMEIINLDFSLLCNIADIRHSFHDLF